MRLLWSGAYHLSGRQTAFVEQWVAVMEQAHRLEREIAAHDPVPRMHRATLLTGTTRPKAEAQLELRALLDHFGAMDIGQGKLKQPADWKQRVETRERATAEFERRARLAQRQPQGGTVAWWTPQANNVWLQIMRQSYPLLAVEADVDEAAPGRRDGNRSAL